MSARAHGGIGGVGPRGGCRGGSGGGGNSEAAARRRARRRTNPLSLQVFLDLPPNLRSAVVGRGGDTVRRIEDTSGARVKVPDGRNGRVKVLGDEVPLLAACRAIAQVVRASSSEAADRLDVLGIAVDAGPQLGRLNGSMHVNRADETIDAAACDGSGSEQPTLLCRASATAPSGVEFAYIAHAIHIPASVVNASDTADARGDNNAGSQNRITQEDVEVTLANLAFAQGAGGSTGESGSAGDLPISVCCIKGDCIFISGIEIVGANTSGGGINSVVEEMKKLVRL